MLFQLDVTLAESDYLAFNVFHSLQSNHGKKQLRKSRIIFITCMAILALLVILMLGRTTISAIYVTTLGLFTILFMLLFGKILKLIVRMQLKSLKKTGKLPFDSVSKLEFYEDHLVEITASKRIEQRYDVMERICVAADRFILLYTSSVNAYILPIPQLRQQLDQEEFLSFLSQKCNTVEYYSL